MTAYERAEDFDTADAGSEFDRAEQHQSANPLDDTGPGPVGDASIEADTADVNDQAEAVLPDDQPATTWVGSSHEDNRVRLGDFNPDA